MTGAEWYATIYAFAESPKAKGVLWAGSDDGLIHISRNGGTSWDNVTPPGYGKFTRTAHIDASPHDPAVAYVAANRYQQDDFAPYLWKTTDYGKTWTKIVAGIPGSAFTRVVREDPARRGLLYAGTEYGVWVSLDDGAQWQPLQLNLPRVSVRDLRVHGNDLIAATHGRAFWVIDDLSPLRELTDVVRAKSVHLFQPATAMLWDGFGWRRDGAAGENPPPGALVDYWLKETPSSGTAVTVQFLDAKGAIVRTFTAANAADSAKAATDSIPAKKGATDSLSYYAADSIPRIRQGSNRFFWNLRYPNIRRMKNTVIDEGHL
ncbi:MAG: glycosyl hydrolase, partial [Aquincola sp.]|nr:glycosyl hydrolase [Aquincola sp.]